MTMNLKQQALLRIHTESVLNVLNTAKNQRNDVQFNEFLDNLKNAATHAKSQSKSIPVANVSYSKLLNYIKSIHHFKQSEGYIEIDMIKSLHSDMHQEIVQATTLVLNTLEAASTKKMEAKTLAPTFSDGELTSVLPSDSNKMKLLSFDILAPFCRYYANEDTLNNLGISYNYIGDDNQSDYVVLASQILLALPIARYRAFGEDYVEDAVSKVSAKLKTEFNLVESTPARNKKCLTHVFFWIMEAPRLTAFRKKMNNSDLEWGLML